jgi:hypothetical protein
LFTGAFYLNIKNKEDPVPKHKDARSEDVIAVLNDLHERKVLNLDTSIKDLLNPSALGKLNRGDPVAEAIIYSGCHYALVYKAESTPTVEEVDTLASAIRNSLSSDKS